MKSLMISCLLITVVGCVQNESGTQNLPPAGSYALDRRPIAEIKEMNLITVSDLNGFPLQGAKVLIGNRLGQPFINNMLQTDENGQTAPPGDWNGPANVTVSYPGYLRVTYLNMPPQSLNFKLRPLEKAGRIELSGTTSGFGNLERNNIADFGIVVPSLTKRDLFAFSLDKIISPEMDLIEIAGMEAKIPSNLTLPRQKETYIVPITLQKEKYRLNFTEPGLKKIYAMHGRFPFKQVVDQIRQKVPFQTLVNYFDFQSGTLRDVDLVGPTNLNLPVNEVYFNSFNSVRPPEGLGSATTMLAISLFQEQGYLYPTDIHKVESPQAFMLNGLGKSNRLLLSMILPTEDFNATTEHSERTSAELVPHTPNHTPTFLGLLNSPQIQADGWSIGLPTNPSEITPLTTYAVLSKTLQQGKHKVIVREWEFYTDAWTDHLQIPEWPATDSPEFWESQGQNQTQQGTEGRRWEITFIGTNQKLPFSPSAKLGPDVVDITSHISFTSLDF